MSLRQRRPREAEKSANTETEVVHSDSIMNWLRRQPLWIVLAVASGTCAAINGVFAKLTTTALTSTFASSIAALFGLAEDNKFVNVGLRGTFFGLNIVFNIAMWALFTAALTRSNSTTRVSIVNVSSNFFITAILGAMIFGEKLPLGWWLGAGLLAAGNVVIGRREEAEKPGGTIGLDETLGEAQETENLLVEEEDLVELRESFDDRQPMSLNTNRAGRGPGEDVDNTI